MFIKPAISFYRLLFGLLCLVAIHLATNAPAMAACSVPNTLTNGTTADATAVMGNFTSLAGCAAPLASPAFSGNVSITSSSGDSLDVSNHGHAVIKATATATGGAYLELDRYGSTYNSAVTFYTDGTPDFQIGTDTAAYGIFGIFDYGNSTLPFAINEASGYVGINTATPGYTLHVNGTAYATAAAGALSDRRHKKDIEPLTMNAMQLVRQLKPVSFFWKKPTDDGMQGRQLGFIAQDVQKVLPDTVLTMRDKDKTLGLKYSEFIPLLTRAIQQQDAEIAALKAESRKQRQEVVALRSREEAEITQLQVQFVTLQRKLNTQAAQK